MYTQPVTVCYSDSNSMFQLFDLSIVGAITCCNCYQTRAIKLFPPSARQLVRCESFPKQFITVYICFYFSIISPTDTYNWRSIIHHTRLGNFALSVYTLPRA